MDAIVAVDIFKNLVLAKIMGQDPRLHQEAASAVTVDKFLSTTRSLSQGIVDVGYVRKTNPNRVCQHTHRVIEKGFVLFCLFFVFFCLFCFCK